LDSERQLRHALADGEDFELLLATPRSEADRILADQPCAVPITEIGSCTPSPEVWLIDDAGRRPLPEIGYEHGRGP
jgi:thiamine-monophosphate kinase